MRLHTLYIIAWCACLHAGCRDEETLYENFHAIPGEGWDRDRGVTFDVEIPRPGSYSFTLYLRHTIDVKQANVSCLLSVSRQGVPLIEERAELFVINDKGKWRGSGAALKTVKFPEGMRHALDSAGTYRLEIRHRMKEKVLKGIKDVGIQVNGEK